MDAADYSVSDYGQSHSTRNYQLYGYVAKRASDSFGCPFSIVVNVTMYPDPNRHRAAKIDKWINRLETEHWPDSVATHPIAAYPTTASEFPTEVFITVRCSRPKFVSV